MSFQFRRFLIVVFCFHCAFHLMMGQQKLDNSIVFDFDDSLYVKEYSVYIPSTYDANTPNKLMVGFHPLNTNRWDAKSWRDTLTAFSEMNGLILFCPDGGPDGVVDSDVDTAFTSFMLDSVFLWYNINPDKVFAMGFSVGGRATYTYGLNHVYKFAGFIPIGAAVNGTSEVMTVLNNAKDKPYFIVHGSLDNMTTRFWPIRNALDGQGACVADSVLAFVPHTIDFPNRNAILTHAFNWVDTVQCGDVISSTISLINEELQLVPNLISSNGKMRVAGAENLGIVGQSYALFDTNGQLVESAVYQGQISTRELVPGAYWIQFKFDGKLLNGKFTVAR